MIICDILVVHSWQRFDHNMHVAVGANSVIGSSSNTPVVQKLHDNLHQATNTDWIIRNSIRLGSSFPQLLDSFSGMSLDSEANKWTCEYCTYENFPSAVKCTMCKGAKPLITEDIYKLGNDTQSHNSPTLNTVASPLKQSDRCNTWRCDICKHVNSIGTKECVACNTSRYNEASVQEQLSSLTIGENELVPAAVNDQRGQPNQKWSCSVCTYENWPKAMKCIMCLTSRNRLSPVSSTNCINSPERELFVNSRTTEDNLIRSKK